MDVALGVSMTPTTVRMVLVEGEKADGATVDYDVFDITGSDGAANSSAPEQVIAAILGTREGADAGGHRLVSTGVTWSDHAEAAELREALAAGHIDDVMLISELHAAGALAQAAGRAVGYDKTALLVIEHNTATASVVETADGSIVKVDSRSLHSADAMDVLTDLVRNLAEHSSQPDGVFLLGSGVDIASLKERLEDQLTIPLSAPEDPELALARGAALAAADAPQFDALTVGLAYSHDPDGTTAGEAYPADELVTEGTEVAAVASASRPADRKPFMLVGSSLTGVFVVGVVALVISLAVSIRPTVDSRPSPGKVAVPPSVQAAPPPAVQNVPPAVQQPPAAVPAPPAPPSVAETIAPPVPVVQQQPLPRKVVVADTPAPAAAPPAPAAEPPAPAPEAPPLAPAYLPPPAYSPGYSPGYYPPQAPGYYPPQAPAYIPPPSPPVVGLPPIIGFGPGPSPRGSDPRWYPPQQQWPSGPRWGHGDDGGGNPGRFGRSPFWLWPGD
jgi:hypothetical protein